MSFNFVNNTTGLMSSHASIIQLAIAYTLLGAFVFTVIITCLSLVGLVKFSDRTQQQKLFYTLIVEVVVISTAFFSGFLEFNPTKIEGIFKSESPTQTIKNYYFELNEGNKSLAYDFLSKRFKDSISFAQYEKSLSFWEVGHISPWDEIIEDKTATVKVNLKCFNVDGIKEYWSGSIQLVKENGIWKIDTMKDLVRN